MPREKKGEVMREHVATDLMLTDPQSDRIAKMIAEYLDAKRKRRVKTTPEHEEEGEFVGQIEPPKRKQRVEMMAHAYAKEDPEPDRTGLVGKADQMRAHILSMSLFPNIFNKKFLDREMP